MTRLVTKFGRNDLKLIGRDSFLIFMFGFVAIIAMVLRFGLPWLNRYLAETGVMPSASFSMPLADLYPMIIAFMAIYTGGLLVGTIFGFVLLDEKDNHTLTAMLVTPVPLNHYLLYRVGLPAVLAFVIILGMAFFVNLALPAPWQMVLLALGGALTAPIISLFFATFAENKVQGFAFSKFAGISGWSILIGWFVPEPWQWLIGLYPPFWVSKAYWMALAGNPWWGAALMVGIVSQLALILLLLRQFHKMAYR